MEKKTETQQSQRIEDYLSQRSNALEKQYSKDSVPVLIEGERKMLQAAIERGDLEGWQDGVDPLKHIVDTIQKKLVQPDGSFQLETTEISPHFSREIHELVERSAVEKSGIVSVGVNASGSLHVPKKQEGEIFSLGQGGCTQVVLASTSDTGSTMTAFHYSPIKWSALCDEIKRKSAEYLDKKSEAMIFINPDEDASIISTVIQNALPNCNVRIEKLELGVASTNADHDVLRAKLTKEGHIAVSLKGENFFLLSQEKKPNEGV